MYYIGQVLRTTNPQYVPRVVVMGIRDGSVDLSTATRSAWLTYDEIRECGYEEVQP